MEYLTLVKVLHNGIMSLPFTAPCLLRRKSCVIPALCVLTLRSTSIKHAEVRKKSDIRCDVQTW